MFGPVTAHHLCMVAHMHKHNACLLAHIAQRENDHLRHACETSAHVSTEQTHNAPSQYAREPVSPPAQTQLQGMYLQHACWQSPHTPLMSVITTQETVGGIDSRMYVCMYVCTDTRLTSS
jgi:hypothetical protein